MTHDPEIRKLARVMLSRYRLSGPEREQELAALSEQIQQVVEVHLETLEHRRITSSVAATWPRGMDE